MKKFKEWWGKLKGWYKGLIISFILYNLLVFGYTIAASILSQCVEFHGVNFCSIPDKISWIFIAYLAFLIFTPFILILFIIIGTLVGFLIDKTKK